MISYAKFDYPHRRYNPLKDEWLIVSPQRAQRPWQGEQERRADATVPQFDPQNPLCPGVQRPSGITNPNYERTFVFENDFPALLPLSRLPKEAQLNCQTEHSPLFKTALVEGECRVVCFHRRSDLQLATMSREDVKAVVDCWQEQASELSARYAWVQIFENKGATMGCSNPHPHCQIWCSDFLPNEPRIKDGAQRRYWHRWGRALLVDYAAEELTRRERVVCLNDSWLVVVPFWAVWPYETMLLPRRHVLRLTDLTEPEKWHLADIMRQLLVKYDNLFRCSFPYSMGWHQAPGGAAFLHADCRHWQLHAIYLPPLLRSATVKKFMAGFEMFCEPQRDLTPESAAATLRQMPLVHYSSEQRGAP